LLTANDDMTVGIETNGERIAIRIDWCSCDVDNGCNPVEKEGSFRCLTVL